MTDSNDVIGTINPNKIATRDSLMLLVLAGATKAAVHKDHKKQSSKDACRGRQDYSKDYD